MYVWACVRIWKKKTLIYHATLNILFFFCFLFRFIFVSVCFSCVNFHLSMLCVRRWNVIFRLRRKELSHKSHLNWGRFRSCVTIWTFKLPALDNIIPHVSHLNWWRFTGRFKLDALVNIFLHVSRRVEWCYQVQATWRTIWTFKLPALDNIIPHVSHLNWGGIRIVIMEKAGGPQTNSSPTKSRDSI